MNDCVAVIDDSPDSLHFLQLALKAKRVPALTFESGAAALDYFKRTKTKPSLILVDLRMKEMSGEDFIRHVRAEAGFHETKIYITSGWHDLETITKVTGADGHFQKPIRLQELYRVIREILGQTPHHDPRP